MARWVVAVGALGAAVAGFDAPGTTPPVTLTLTIDADHHWTVRLTNTGTESVRIVADPRLLSFDVTTAGHTTRCALPADMTPSVDTERSLVVPRGRSWSAAVDPRLYCFSVAQLATLVPGASVVASFGWSNPRNTPPFVVAPTSVDAGVGPARLVTAPAITLGTLPSDAGAEAESPDGAAEGGPAPTHRVETGTWSAPGAYPTHLRVTLPARLDVSRTFEQSVTMTVTNDGDRPVQTLFAPTTVGFFLETPGGHWIRCGGGLGGTAFPDFVTTLAPRGRTTQTVDLGATCGAFTRMPGVYEVRARVDTRHLASPHMPAFWNGEAIGEPMLMRVRVGEDAMPQPTLDP